MSTPADCAAFAAQLQRELGGLASDAERAALAEHAAGCPRCARERDELTAIAGDLAALLGPPTVDEQRRAAALIARLPAATRAHPAAGRRRGRRRLAAAGLLAAGLIAARWAPRRHAPHALPGAAQPRSQLTAPLPFAGPQSLERALASHAALDGDARRPRWLGRLQLTGITGRRLLDSALADAPGARALALDWWSAQPARIPGAALIARARRTPAAGAVGIRLAAQLPARDAVRLLERLARRLAQPAPAIAALARHDGALAAPALVRLLAVDATRTAAGQALDATGNAAIEAVALALQAGAPSAPLLSYLGRARSPKATELLVATVRARRADGPAAIAALARRPAARAAPALVRWVEQPRLGPAALAALAELGRPGLDRLRQLIARRREALAVAALEAAGRVRSAAAVRALSAGLSRPSLARRAVALLGGQTDPAALRWLSRAARVPQLRESAYRALATIGSPGAIRLLAAECVDPERARAVVGALGPDAGPRALPALAAALAHPRVSRRALARVADQPSDAALQVLIGALARPHLRQRAHRHLQQRTGQRLGPDPAAWQRWYRRGRPGARDARPTRLAAAHSGARAT